MLLSARQLLLIFYAVFIGIHTQLFSGVVASISWELQSNHSQEKERDRAYARQQFTKNFKDLQVISQNLLKEHENNLLTADRLAKDLRSINKSAKALKALMVLGDLAEPVKVDKEINTPQQFDKSLRRLIKHIYDFAHNPIHQSNKVFNTDQAQLAHADLLSIIDLSKAIENKAKRYARAAETVQ